MNTLLLNMVTAEPAAPQSASSGINSIPALEAFESERHAYFRGVAKRFDRKLMSIPMVVATMVSGASVANASSEKFGANHYLTSARYDSLFVPPVELEEQGASDSVTGLSNWFAAWASSDALSNALPGAFSGILADLETLSDGWNGDESVAPSSYVKSDVHKLAKFSASSWQQPEVEVDNDGSVALRWEGDDRIIALTFNGNGRAIGTMYPRLASGPREILLSDDEQVTAFLEINEVKSLIL